MKPFKMPVIYAYVQLYAFDVWMCANVCVCASCVYMHTSTFICIYRLVKVYMVVAIEIYPGHLSVPRFRSPLSLPPACQPLNTAPPKRVHKLGMEKTWWYVVVCVGGCKMVGKNLLMQSANEMRIQMRKRSDGWMNGVGQFNERTDEGTNTYIYTKRIRVMGCK